MQKTKFLTAIVLVAALLFTACLKIETVNSDQNQTEDTGGTDDTDGADDTGGAEVADYSYDETTKTYTVYTANGLLKWNEDVQNDFSLNCTLDADIDLTDIEYEWLLVGDEDNPYTGTFEGGDHTITGLTVNYDSSNYVGLIGYLDSEGKVQNVTLENVNIIGKGNVGGVVGYNNGGTMTNCSVSGTVSGTDTVGGVVGFSQDGTVTACYASGSVTGTASVGGVVGFSMNGTVIACYASGSVSGDDSYTGGVVGGNWGTVTACYASGSLSASSDTAYVGGVVGINNYTVTACYWSDYDGDGIGMGGFGEVTRVGSDGCETWKIAQDTMNSALANANSEWRYENAGTSANAGDAPTLTKNQ